MSLAGWSAANGDGRAMVCPLVSNTEDRESLKYLSILVGDAGVIEQLLLVMLMSESLCTVLLAIRVIYFIP